jgi:iron complex outermembrane receptor protein
MYRFSCKSGLLAGAALSLSLSTQANETEAPVYRLDDFTVSAGPTARAVADFASPFTALDESALRQQKSATLGDLLDGQPGVTATAFGAGASRPIIRGFDGPRVRILDSGIEALDVSATSPDHAVPIEPLLVERVEIVRGPATLLYGSSAIGGVVNVIERKIPRERVEADAVTGALEASYETANEGKRFLGYTTVGGEDWAINVSGLTRDSKDYDIPETAELNPEPGEATRGRLENSFVETDAYSVGGSWFFNQESYFGFAYSYFDSLYGVPGHGHAHHEEEHDDHDHDHDHDHEEGEESVSIDLERIRYDAELVIVEPTDWIEAARIRLGYTDYAHTELEGAETGTVFENEGWEFRGEIAHRELGLIDSGVIGLQFADSDFSAEGDEAFTPPATTRNQAVFLSEHIHGDSLHWEFGARLENQTVQADGFDSDYSDLALSVAASAIWDFRENQSVTLSLQRSQRHPSSTELYADGPHLATEQYEIGDPDLGLETAYGVDLSYRLATKDWSGKLSVFYTYFEDYIFAGETGAEEDELPVFQFSAVDASFWGFEGELEYIAFETLDSRLSYRLLADYVRAVNEDDDTDLPRIPPFRLGGEVRYSQGPWSAGTLLRHSFKQSANAPGETETDGYTELKLDVARSFDLNERVRITIFAQAENLLDEDIRYHTSFLKDVAPMPGRSLLVGVRGEF